MFDNTVPLTIIQSDDEVVNVSITDTDDGKTVRRHNAGSGVFTELVNARQESQENKPVVSDRFLVRVNRVKPGSSGAPVTASVAMTITYPRDGFDNDDIVGLVQGLICFLAPDSATHLQANAGYANPGSLGSRLVRVFAGET